MEPKQWMNVPLAQLSTQLGCKVFICWVIGRETYAPEYQVSKKNKKIRSIVCKVSQSKQKMKH